MDRLLLSLLFHCSKDADHVRAMRDIEEALTRMPVSSDIPYSTA